jgi:hypothetical protein
VQARHVTSRNWMMAVAVLLSSVNQTLKCLWVSLCGMTSASRLSANDQCSPRRSYVTSVGWDCPRETHAGDGPTLVGALVRVRHWCGPAQLPQLRSRCLLSPRSTRQGLVVSDDTSAARVPHCHRHRSNFAARRFCGEAARNGQESTRSVMQGMFPTKLRRTEVQSPRAPPPAKQQPGVHAPARPQWTRCGRIENI